MFIQLEDIKQAKENLAGVIKDTPLQYSKTLSNRCGNAIYLKPENLQKTGSFKIRGAYNKIASLSNAAKKKGVVAFSAGNHGAGTAYAAKALGVQATVVLPENPVPSKKNAIIDYGAKAVEWGTDSIAMYERVLRFHEEDGMEIIHPFEDYFTIAGQGTIGIEIIKELPDVDAVIVPVSGGGLISGVAACLKEMKPTTEVIGVNSEGAQAMFYSLQKGKPSEVNEVNTIADGLMAKRPGELTFRHTQKYVDRLVLVTEKEIAETVAILAERAKLVVEPSGAASLAAILYNHVNLKNKKAVVLVSGGNVNFRLYSQLLTEYANKVFDKERLLK
ncbi:L-threonine ammonia-lyase [Lentibacillus persicus]|uniref:threonine ammonia-lyase n=2 Tax=Lentibacillus persicus TaxID=640948 RepID=A0A1I1VZ93_9BACI|nr:L-threonine ammonia-lyase [Lentibacillus persicus]